MKYFKAGLIHHWHGGVVIIIKRQVDTGAILFKGRRESKINQFIRGLKMLNILETKMHRLSRFNR